VPVGSLVTLDLPSDSPVADLPWVITIGSLGDEEDWEPVVCGPYERAHALALAQAVVADEDLLAVVEPPADPDDPGFDEEAYETRRVRPGRPPTADEVRAGWGRIATRLVDAPRV
jgi:hypothetical protein